MIKFFRRIRRKLIDSGNLKRYLIYALGEVLLVILGILIALGINEWRKDINAQKNEELIIESLSVEFSTTKFHIEQFIDDNENIISASSQLLTLRTNINEGFKASTFDSLFYSSAWSKDLTLNQGIFKELLNTGKLSEISNKNLRVMLSAWEGLLEEARQDVKLGEDYLQGKTMDYVDKNLSWVIMSKYDKTGVQIPAINDRKIDRKIIARELEFENFIFNQLWFTQNKINSAQRLLVLNEKILNEIKKGK